MKCIQAEKSGSCQDLKHDALFSVVAHHHPQDTHMHRDYKWSNPNMSLIHEQKWKMSDMKEGKKLGNLYRIFSLPIIHSRQTQCISFVYCFWSSSKNKKTAYHSLSMSVYLVLPFSSISFSLFHSLKNRRESETGWRKNRRRRNGKSFSRWGRLNEISLLLLFSFIPHEVRI